MAHRLRTLGAQSRQRRARLDASERVDDVGGATPGSGMLYILFGNSAHVFGAGVSGDLAQYQLT